MATLLRRTIIICLLCALALRLAIDRLLSDASLSRRSRSGADKAVIATHALSSSAVDGDDDDRAAMLGGNDDDDGDDDTAPASRLRSNLRDTGGAVPLPPFSGVYSCNGSYGEAFTGAWLATPQVRPRCIEALPIQPRSPPRPQVILQVPGFRRVLKSHRVAHACHLLFFKGHVPLKTVDA